MGHSVKASGLPLERRLTVHNYHKKSRGHVKAEHVTGDQEKIVIITSMGRAQVGSLALELPLARGQGRAGVLQAAGMGSTPAFTPGA